MKSMGANEIHGTPWISYGPMDFISSRGFHMAASAIKCPFFDVFPYTDFRISPVPGIIVRIWPVFSGSIPRFFSRRFGTSPRKSAVFGSSALHLIFQNFTAAEYSKNDLQMPKVDFLPIFFSQDGQLYLDLAIWPSPWLVVRIWGVF